MKVLNRDVVKLIALLLMLGNHIANIFLTQGTFEASLLEYLGYFTAPVMCKFLVDGFYYTRSREKYGKRLLVFALVSQIPFYLAARNAGAKIYNYNMIGTLFLCFLMLCVLDGPWDERRKRMAVALAFVVGSFGDWGIMAEVFVLLFWRLHWKQERGIAGRSDEVITWLIVIATVGLMNILAASSKGASPEGMILSLGSMLGPALAAVCMLFFYNGKQSSRGKTFFKWFNYIFYPAHLMVLVLVKMALG